jgi:hypothetical protein
MEFIADRGQTFEDAATARQAASSDHNRRETPLFAESIVAPPKPNRSSPPDRSARDTPITGSAAWDLREDQRTERLLARIRLTPC